MQCFSPILKTVGSILQGSPIDEELTSFFYLDNYVITKGTYTSGTVEDTQVEDANALVFNETAGTPGADIALNVLPTSLPHQVDYNILYTGNPAHVCYLQVYNETLADWVNITQLVSGIQAAGSYPLNGNNYDLTTTKFRIYHVTAGVTAHHIDIFFLRVHAN